MVPSPISVKKAKRRRAKIGDLKDNREYVNIERNLDNKRLQKKNMQR